MRGRWIVAAVGAALMAGAVGAQSPVPEPDAELAAAKAARATMASPPEFIDGPHAVVPPAELALGHHGVVVIGGIVGVDGHMTRTLIARSSGAPSLDEEGRKVAAASRFKPALDRAGQPVALYIGFPVEFAAYKSDRGGIFDYRCGQFARDIDWWRSAHPGRPDSEHELYKLNAGLNFAGLFANARADLTKVDQAMKTDDFAARWAAAVDRCRTAPDKLARDLIFARR